MRLIAVTLQSSIGALSDPELPREQREIVLELIGPPLGEVVSHVEALIQHLET